MRDNEGRRNEIHNVYDLKGRRISDSVDTAEVKKASYKSGDTKRKAHSLSRKKRRQIIRVALFAFFTVAVIVAAVFGLTQVFCKVDTVTVEYTNKAEKSKRFYANKDIVLATSIEKGDNLLFVSASDVSEKLEKNMPYITTAVVKKDFPSTVVIEVTECAKVYAYKTKAGYCLADENGKFIEMADGKKAKKYTIVTCSDVEVPATGEKISLGKIDEETETYPDTEVILDYLSLLRKSGMNITSVDMKDLSDVKMVYDGRIRILVGKMSDEENGVTAWKKIQLAKNALEKQDEISKTQTGELKLYIPKKAYFTPDKENPTEEKTTSVE